MINLSKEDISTNELKLRINNVSVDLNQYTINEFVKLTCSISLAVGQIVFIC